MRQSYTVQCAPPPYFQCPPGAAQCDHNIVDYIPYAVLYMFRKKNPRNKPYIF